MPRVSFVRIAEGARTLLECLLGRRSAILELASAPGTFSAGLLLLLSAGLAREYDGVFLPFEPWRLPGHGAVDGFEFVELLATAIERAGTGAPAAVRAALAPTRTRTGALSRAPDTARSTRRTGSRPCSPTP